MAKGRGRASFFHIRVVCAVETGEQTTNIRFVFDSEAMELKRASGALDLKGKLAGEVFARGILLTL